MKLNDPIYSDENKAREHLEMLSIGLMVLFARTAETSMRERITKLEGKSTRPGVYKCSDRRQPFTVTVGTVFERSKIPLNKWVLASHLMAASKKGMSAHQLWRMLGFGSYRTAWFMAHRIREAMKEDVKSSEARWAAKARRLSVDGTYIGKAANRAFDKKPRRKAMVMTLWIMKPAARPRTTSPASGPTPFAKFCSRRPAGNPRSFQTRASCSAATGEHYEKHETVLHAAREYVNKDGFSTNINENFFSAPQAPGIYGVYHHVSPAHLGRYVTEFDFRYSSRHVTDAERCAKALEGIRVEAPDLSTS